MEKRLALSSAVESLGGMWKNEEQLISRLQQIQNNSKGEGKTKKIEAIKAQLQYRKKFYQQDFGKLSENGRPLRLEALQIKLIRLMNQTPN